MTFPLYFDEDAPTDVAEMLQRLGYDVLTTQGAGRRRSKDGDQLRFAASEGRAIFTHNVGDYRRLAVEWAAADEEHAGILLSPRESPFVLRDRFLALFELYPDGIANVCMYLPQSE